MLCCEKILTFHVRLCLPAEESWLIFIERRRCSFGNAVPVWFNEQLRISVLLSLRLREIFGLFSPSYLTTLHADSAARWCLNITILRDDQSRGDYSSGASSSPKKDCAGVCWECDIVQPSIRCTVREVNPMMPPSLNCQQSLCRDKRNQQFHVHAHKHLHWP